MTILVGEVLFRTVMTRIYYKFLHGLKFAPSVGLFFFSLIFKFRF